MMAQSEMKNAPPLYGWVIAVAAGAVAFGVSLALVGIEGNGSVLIGLVIALVVGIVFTIAESPAKPIAPRAPAPQVAAAPTVAPAPVAESVTAESESAEAAPQEGTPPAKLDGPVGAADDLKQITGVGPVLEGKLNNLGIYHFWQISRWSADEIAWVDGFLNFKGRIERDEWIKQATELAQSSPSQPPA